MRFGGFLLGALAGLVLSLATGGPFWLFGRLGFVLPATLGIAGGIAARRLPGGRAMSITGYVLGAVALIIAALVCWWIIDIIIHKHGWF